MMPRSNIQRWLLIVGCWFGFALPLAHTISSTSAREASSPVEESPAGYSEAVLVRNVERREAASQTVAATGSLRSPHRPNAAVTPRLSLTGHRWANGLLAPLRT